MGSFMNTWCKQLFGYISDFMVTSLCMWNLKYTLKQYDMNNYGLKTLLAL